MIVGEWCFVCIYRKVYMQGKEVFLINTSWLWRRVALDLY